MIPDFVTEQIPTISSLCRKFRARRLELFGSASKGTFDPARSDLDFLVEFPREFVDGRADSYFGLLFALQELFGRNVDLVEVTAVENPLFLKAIGPTRTTVYAA
ncbi:MAG: nucleotidyltransferase domain-containing protein [Planctomycetes bacterium]|nr:nucleotidyltransferase domain-containing protein [Planctomycetota bacterium]